MSRLPSGPIPRNVQISGQAVRCRDTPRRISPPTGDGRRFWQPAVAAAGIYDRCGATRRVSFEELDRMTLEIKTVIEALLKMDYELRKVHNLKLAFEARSPASGNV